MNVIGLKKWSRNLSQLQKIISSCNYVLSIIEVLEEQRLLSLQERNFREILKKHILMLLEAKRIYWRNRAKIRWAKLRGENTKFFHAVATQSFRTNHLGTITTDDDNVLIGHDNKAAYI